VCDNSLIPMPYVEGGVECQRVQRRSRGGGEAGGKAKVSKGFASPRVQAKALATRKRNALTKSRPNAEAETSERSE